MRLALAAAALALFALPAVAQPPAPGPDSPPASTDGGRPAPTPEMMAARKAMREACSADIAKLCADATAGGGRVMRCIREHRSDLSPGCTQALMAMRQSRPGGGRP